MTLSYEDFPVGPSPQVPSACDASGAMSEIPRSENSGVSTSIQTDQLHCFLAPIVLIFILEFYIMLNLGKKKKIYCPKTYNEKDGKPLSYWMSLLLLLLNRVSRVDLPIFPGSSFQGFLLTSLSSFIHFIEIWTSVTEYGHVPVIVYVCVGGEGGSNKDEIRNPCLCLGSYCKGSRRKRLSFRTWIPGSRIAERVCETENKRNQHGSASASWPSTSQAPARIQSGRDSCLSPLLEGLKSK